MSLQGVQSVIVQAPRLLNVPTAVQHCLLQAWATAHLQAAAQLQPQAEALLRVTGLDHCKTGMSSNIHKSSAHAGGQPPHSGQARGRAEGASPPMALYLNLTSSRLRMALQLSGSVPRRLHPDSQRRCRLGIRLQLSGSVPEPHAPLR